MMELGLRRHRFKSQIMDNSCYWLSTYTCHKPLDFIFHLSFYFTLRTTLQGRQMRKQTQRAKWLNQGHATHKCKARFWVPVSPCLVQDFPALEFLAGCWGTKGQLSFVGGSTAFEPTFLSPNPSPITDCWVVLGKLLNLTQLNLLICKMVVTIIGPPELGVLGVWVTPSTQTASLGTKQSGESFCKGKWKMSITLLLKVWSLD